MGLSKNLAEISQLVGGTLQGDGAFVVEAAAGLKEAGPKDISFLGNPKYASHAAATQAGCVLLPPAGKDLACGAKNRIYVEDPQYAFSQILILIAGQKPVRAPVKDERASIHASSKLGARVSVGAFSVIEAGAVIGDGTVVSPQCFIGENARIGKDCVLHPQSVVRENCVLGDRVILQPGAVIGGDGYGFSTDRKTGKHRKIPQLGNVVLSDDVEIGANTTIDRATTGSTFVASGTKIDNLVQLGHNVQVGKDCLIVSQVGVSGSTILGDRVILAGQAGLIGHLHIGDGAIVMAQTGVMGDVEPGKMIFGTPSRPHRETLKLQALFGRLPELFDSVKEIKKKLGL